MPSGFHLLTRMYGDVTYVSRAEYADRQAMMTKHAEHIREQAEHGGVKVILFAFRLYQLC